MDEDGEKKSVTRTSTAQGLFPFIKEEPYIWQVWPPDCSVLHVSLLAVQLNT